MAYPPEGFEYAGERSTRFRCTACGATGHPGGRWMDTCRRGHKPCRRGCGRMLSVLRNGAARAHPHCPQPPIPRGLLAWVTQP